MKQYRRVIERYRRMIIMALRRIREIAEDLGLSEDEIETYGKYMAKIPVEAIKKLENKPDGKLILVTATSPTPAGEGKTTTSIGLGQALKQMGKSVAVAIREPSLGPCFGIKGGATGGGKSIVEPSDRINLFFTSDFPAVSAAHNLLSALINNHIYHGNSLNIDPKSILFPRAIDMNDRSLREVIVGAGERPTGTMVRDQYVITPASEIMAILALSTDYGDLKERLSKILVAFTHDHKPVFSGDLNAQGAMAALLSDALKPNIVQTSEGVPTFIHTGPFGNIAHGTSSIIADRMALKLADYVVTEAGFGSDLGAEKFMDLVSDLGNLNVSAVVVVTTIKAMKYNGGSKDFKNEDVGALEDGMKNLFRHVENIRNFGFEPVVAVNEFPSDTDREKELLFNALRENKIDYALSRVFAEGGQGGTDLAEKVLEKLSSAPESINRVYSKTEDVREKIEKIARRVYGASGVNYSAEALRDLRRIKRFGFSDFYVCMAKTQYSLSDNPSLLNAPENFTVEIKRIAISSGAGFIVPMLGDVMTMPGLPTRPAAEDVDIKEDGTIVGLS